MTARALILPPLRRTAADAQRFATIVHEGQVDKAGRPYGKHLSRVARRLLNLSWHCPFWKDQDTDEAEQIAWLHDTIEDAATVTVGTLAREGFSETVVAAVNMLTKPDRPLPYDSWISRLADIGNLHEILVKLADVEDNSDPERLALLPEETRARLLKKYEPAKEVLRAAARRKGWQG